MEEGRKLMELRVVDLKALLDQRDLEKSGIKSVLLERLTQSVRDDGHDPDTYVFNLDDDDPDADAANKSGLSDSAEESAHDLGSGKMIDEHSEPMLEEKSEGHKDDDCEELSENAPQSATEESDAAERKSAEEAPSNVVAVTAQGEKNEEGETEPTPDQDAEPDLETTYPIDNIPASEITESKPVEEDLNNVESASEKTGEKESEVVEDAGETQVNDDKCADEPRSTEIEGAVETENIEESGGINVEGLSRLSDVDESVLAADDNLMNDAMIADHVSLDENDKNETLYMDVEDIAEVDASSEFAMVTDEEQLVVNVDDSDTNLDYDLGEGGEEQERDAPTPTRDESVDTQATSGTALNTVEGEARPSSKSADSSKGDSKDLSNSQNLWVSGLSSTTRATDLKTVFSKYGKVVGAKVVTNANKPGSKCYGYVTMSSADEAAKCIQHLHRTDLHGKMVSVEKAKSDPAAQARAAARATESSTEPDKKMIPTSKTALDSKTTDGEKREESSSRRRISLTSASARARAEREKSKQEVEPGDKSRSDKSRSDKPEDPLERERRRLRVQEKRMRDDDYRRRQIFLKEKRVLAEQQRRIRADQLRMDRERDKLRVDRERVKIEEMKLANLVRERGRHEATLLDLRQRVDREREELKRVETLRLEELRRSTAVKRSYDSGSRHEEPHWEAKRPALSERYSASSRHQPSADSRYGEERNTDRRSIARKAPVADRASRGTDDRYYAGRPGHTSSVASTERREYGSTRPSSVTRHTDRRSNGSSRGAGWPDTAGRSSQQSSSARFTGSRSEGRAASGVWQASASNPQSLLGESPDLFGSASAHAANVMMNAAAIGRGSGGSSGQSSRYGGSGYGGGSRRY